MMTPTDVADRIAQIAEKAWDAEVAHSMEDALHAEVLRAIADGYASDPAELAAAALKTVALSFARWSA